MNAAVSTLDANTALADRLRRFGAKIIARIAGTSARTTENWLSAESAPTWKHVSIMMRDDELLRELLIAAGRVDVADAHAMLSKLREAKKALEGVSLD